MKDLNECKAEIFRRSEKRIKARRKNVSRVFAVCVPIVVIISVLPITMSIRSNNPESEGAYYETADKVTDSNDLYNAEDTKNVTPNIHNLFLSFIPSKVLIKNN